MLELILNALAEFGLIREDFLHKKRISKKEKEDGIRRPIQKYFLKPSALVIIGAFVIVTLSSILFLTYQRSSVFPEKTKVEMIEMTEWIEKWKKTYGNYPTDINEMIGNNPIRQGWKEDAWHHSYQYSKTRNGQGFTLISAGSDGQFETVDDIELE